MAKDKSERRRTAEDSEKIFDELSERVKINRDDLDTEVAEQPELWRQIAAQHELALSRRDLAKLELSELEAEVDMDIRQRCARSEEKVTEAGIKSRITTDKRIYDGTRKLLRLTDESRRWQNLLESFGQRKYALDNLVDLYIGGYFGQVSAGGKRAGAKDSAYERVREHNKRDYQGK